MPVQLFLVPLAALPHVVADLNAVLDPDERLRAAAFRRTILSDRYVVAHGTLRLALGACLGTAPESLRFARAPRGKPSIDERVRFNISHSGDLMLLGMTRDQEIGVDIEQVTGLDVADLLPDRDRAAIATVPPDCRCRAALQAWTRMEARSKASGAGLADGTPVNDEDGFTTWDLEVDDQYVASVSVQGGGAGLVCTRFDSSEAAAAFFRKTAKGVDAR